MTPLAAAAVVAATEKPELTYETVRPGLIALFFFVALFVATYFLWRSMNKQLKRVDAHFEAEHPNEDDVRDPAHVSAQEQIAIDQAALGRVGREPRTQADVVPPTGAEGTDGKH